MVASYRDWSAHRALDKYRKLEKLGEGAFGEVWLVEDVLTKKQWALKAVFLNTPGMPKEHRCILACEATFLTVLRHPHIVRGRHIIKGTSSEPWCLVMEALKGGPMFAELASAENVRQYSERIAATLFKQIVSAVAYMHAKLLLHRDIKPENVVFKSPGTEWGSGVGEIKLIDFGLATVFSADALSYGSVGSPGYMAPEVLRNKAHTPAMDIYSLGVLLFVMLVGRKPMSNATAIKQSYSLTQAWEYEATNSSVCPNFAQLSLASKNLLMSMLELDPLSRPTAEQVLENAWLCHAGEAPLRESVRTGMQEELKAREKLVRSVRRLRMAQRFTVTTFFGSTTSALQMKSSSAEVEGAIPRSSTMGGSSLPGTDIGSLVMKLKQNVSTDQPEPEVDPPVAAAPPLATAVSCDSYPICSALSCDPCSVLPSTPTLDSHPLAFDSLLHDSEELMAGAGESVASSTHENLPPEEQDCSEGQANKAADRRSEARTALSLETWALDEQAVTMHPPASAGIPRTSSAAEQSQQVSGHHTQSQVQLLGSSGLRAEPRVYLPTQAVTGAGAGLHIGLNQRPWLGYTHLQQGWQRQRPLGPAFANSPAAVAPAPLNAVGLGQQQRGGGWNLSQGSISRGAESQTLEGDSCEAADQLMPQLARQWEQVEVAFAPKSSPSTHQRLEKRPEQTADGYYARDVANLTPGGGMIKVYVGPCPTS